MGTNKRYGDRQFDAILAQALVQPKPISLSEKEVGVVSSEVTDVAEPIRVSAWVRFPESPIRVEAKAVAWTDRAVWVEFTMHNGATLRAWVWASAVTRL